jgi:hypothetical protein
VDTSATPPANAAPETGAKANSAEPPAPRDAKRSSKWASSKETVAKTPEQPASPNANGANTSSEAKTAARGKTGADKAHDSIQLDTTDITGNRELPKVLYIVPWKRSDLGDLVGKPANSLLDEVLAPVDRDVFKRENRYYDALKPDAGGTPVPGTAGPPAVGAAPEAGGKP